ncbi:ANTAR domain-containing protein [Streptomyces sp. NPDC052496]|uniref:ANTAR domain-containing protein n=1 Tax=Streptomyces sp. NPDC052496 TaxID=3154951 RepID=UPI003434EECF
MPEPAHSAPPLPGHDPGQAAPAAPAPPEPCLMAIEVAADGDHAGVVVRGELDLDTGRHVEPALHAALGHAAHGLDLHLGAVHFCDCAGLGILLRLRNRALHLNKTVSIRTSSPAVDHILDLTGTRELFDTPAAGDRSAPRAPARSRIPRQGAGQDADEELLRELAQLRRAMRTRPAIDLARGILMATFSLSPEAAWTVLVTTSQKTNIKLHRLAQDLVGSLQGAALPAAVQQQLAAAVAAADAAALVPPETAARRGSVPGQHTAPPGS